MTISATSDLVDISAKPVFAATSAGCLVAASASEWSWNKKSRGSKRNRGSRRRIRFPQSVAVIGGAGALAGNHGRTDRMFGCAPDTEGRTFLGFLHAAHNQTTDALGSFR